MTPKTYQDLTVWQKSMDLVHEIYVICKQLPKSEIYILNSQMQRSAISIPSNIAEGYRRNNRKEYIQFLAIANGSAAELETQLLITKREYPNFNINYIIALNLLTEIQKILTSVIIKLKQSLLNPQP